MSESDRIKIELRPGDMEAVYNAILEEAVNGDEVLYRAGMVMAHALKDYRDAR